MKNLLVGLLCLVLSSSASAITGLQTGNDLQVGLTMWNAPSKDPDWVVASFAAGYVMGITETLNGIYWCTRPQVTVAQITAVVLKYLNDNLNKLDSPANMLTNIALTTAFPCPKK